MGWRRRSTSVAPCPGVLKQRSCVFSGLSPYRYTPHANITCATNAGFSPESQPDCAPLLVAPLTNT